jgi:PHD/YefM family antitoxin component YafN of YafNO toxin-antitoxin module
MILIIMNGLLGLSQTEPISSLPRDYSALLKRTRERKEPVVFLKRNRPVGALLDWELLVELLELKAKAEEKEVLENILQSEKEFRTGKAKVLKSLADI